MPLRKTKHYQLTKFSPEAIREALETFAAGKNEKLKRINSEVELDDEGWDFDNDADFFSSYREPKVWFANYSFATTGEIDARFRVVLKNDLTAVAVTLKDKSAVERVFDVFEKYAP